MEPESLTRGAAWFANLTGPWLRPRQIWGATGARGIATKGDPQSVDGKALKALSSLRPGFGRR